MIFLYTLLLIAAFLVMFKCADILVTGACGISDVLKVPRLITGIVFVGLATTAPEFGVSVVAAFLGDSDIALGNAIGSVIADDGIALGLAAVVAPALIYVNCRTLKIAGVFLLFIDFLAYFLARNGAVGRLEGLIFIALLLFYFILLYRTKNLHAGIHLEEQVCPQDLPGGSKWKRLKKPGFLFFAGICGVFLASHYGVLPAATYITEFLGVPKFIIASTVIAVGTSLPEISTCIMASRRGEGELAVGDIIGADVLNILWIIGAASIVRPIHVDVSIINFAFPFMILIVTVMLFSLRLGCRIGKRKGVVLIALYAAFIILTLVLFS